MTWVRTEDTMPLHPKILRLSDGAFRLWSNALHFANRGVTDGKIGKEFLPSLNHHGRWSARQIQSFVDELVSSVPPYDRGLWSDEGDHFAINDYAHFQAEAMKDRVNRKREIDRERQRRKRDREEDNNRESLGMSRRDNQRDNYRESRRETSVPTRPDPDLSPIGDSKHSPRAARVRRAEDPTDSAIAEVIRSEIPEIPSLDPKTQGNRKAIGTLRAWAKRSGGNPIDAIRSAAKGARGDSWLAERGYPLAAIAKRPDTYVARAMAHPAAPRGMAPAMSHEDFAAEVKRLGGEQEGFVYGDF